MLSSWMIWLPGEYRMRGFISQGYHGDMRVEPVTRSLRLHGHSVRRVVMEHSVRSKATADHMQR